MFSKIPGNPWKNMKKTVFSPETRREFLYHWVVVTSAVPIPPSADRSPPRIPRFSTKSARFSHGKTMG